MGIFRGVFVFYYVACGCTPARPRPRPRGPRLPAAGATEIRLSLLLWYTGTHVLSFLVTYAMCVPTYLPYLSLGNWYRLVHKKMVLKSYCTLSRKTKIKRNTAQNLTKPAKPVMRPRQARLSKLERSRHQKLCNAKSVFAGF